MNPECAILAQFGVTAKPPLCGDAAADLNGAAGATRGKNIG